jgi:hypothetical protein
MRAYKVISPAITLFVGSEVEARQARMAMMETQSVKRKDTDVQLLDIPTNKVDLLAWLNTQEVKRG